MALIVVAILLHFFGPAELETDELIVIGLLILALIGFRVWLRRTEYDRSAQRLSGRGHWGGDR